MGCGVVVQTVNKQKKWWIDRHLDGQRREKGWG